MVYRNFRVLVRLTACENTQLARRLATEVDPHERDDELVIADVAVVDEFGSPPESVSPVRR